MEVERPSSVAEEFSNVDSHILYELSNSMKRAKEPFSHTSVCTLAAKYGLLEFLKWCRSEGHSWDCDTTNAAAKYGHLHLLQWCIENGCEHESVLEGAAEGGWINILKWYTEHFRATKPAYLSVYAAKGGQLEMLQWLMANGYPFHTGVYNAAAKNGHTDIMDWAYDYEKAKLTSEQGRGCPITDTVWVSALSNKTLLDWCISKRK